MVSPAVIKALARELSRLVESPLDGVRVSMCESDMLSFSGWIQGSPETPYAGGFFRITFDFDGIDFPTQPPRCRFVTPIFHPNVSTHGDICISTLQKDWSPHHGIRDILLAIKCLLIHPNPDSALNPQASTLMHEDWTAYSQTAHVWTQVHASKPPPCFHSLTPKHNTITPTSKPIPKPSLSKPTTTAPKRGLRRL